MEAKSQENVYYEHIVEFIDLLNENNSQLEQLNKELKIEFTEFVNKKKSIKSLLVSRLSKKKLPANQDVMFQAVEDELTVQNAMITTIKSLQRDMNRAYFDNDLQLFKEKLSQTLEMEIGLLFGTLVIACITELLSSEDKLKKDVGNSFQLSAETIALFTILMLHRYEDISLSTETKYWKKDKTQKDILKSLSAAIAKNMPRLEEITKLAREFLSNEEDAITKIRNAIEESESLIYGEKVAATLSARLLDAKRRFEIIEQKIDDGDLDISGESLVELSDMIAAVYGTDAIFSIFFMETKRKEMAQSEQIKQRGPANITPTYDTTTTKQNEQNYYRQASPETTAALKQQETQNKMEKIEQEIAAGMVYLYYTFRDHAYNLKNKIYNALKIKKKAEQSFIENNRKLKAKKSKQEDTQQFPENEAKNIDDVIDSEMKRKKAEIEKESTKKKRQLKEKGVFSKLVEMIIGRRSKEATRVSPGQPTSELLKSIYKSYGMRRRALSSQTTIATAINQLDDKERKREKELEEIFKEIEELGKEILETSNSKNYQAELKNADDIIKKRLKIIDTKLQGLEYGTDNRIATRAKINTTILKTKKNVELALSSQNYEEFSQGIKALNQLRASQSRGAKEADPWFSVLLKNSRNLQNMATKGSSEAFRALFEIALSSSKNPAKEFSKRFLLETQHQLEKTIPNWRTTTRKIIAQYSEQINEEKNSENIKFITEYAKKLAENGRKEGFNILLMLLGKVKHKENVMHELFSAINNADASFALRNWKEIRDNKILRDEKSTDELDNVIIEKCVQQLNVETSQDATADAIANYVTHDRIKNSEPINKLLNAIFSQTNNANDTLSKITGVMKALAKAIAVEEKIGSCMIAKSKALESLKNKLAEKKLLSTFNNEIEANRKNQDKRITLSVKTIAHKAECVFLYGLWNNTDDIERVLDKLEESNDLITCNTFKPNVLVDEIDFDYGFGLIITDGIIMQSEPTNTNENAEYEQTIIKKIDSAYSLLEANQFRTKKQLTGIRLSKVDFSVAKPIIGGFFIIDKDVKNGPITTAKMNSDMITDEKTHLAIYEAAKKFSLEVFILDINTMELKRAKFNKMLQRYTA